MKHSSKLQELIIAKQQHYDFGGPDIISLALSFNVEFDSSDAHRSSIPA
jgi:hypothetical protein